VYELDTGDLQTRFVSGARKLAARATEVAPTATAAVIACLLAWREGGSVAAPDWLGYGLALVFLLGAILLTGVPRRPSRLALVALGGLVGLAAWAAVSAAWAPLPSLARDEALLTALYAVAFALPLVTLRTPRARILALGAIVAAIGVTAVATAIRVGWGDDPILPYAATGRLYFPITYVNAQASFVLIGFWPAVALAARRSGWIPLRALALAAATAMVGVAMLTQSRGAAVALVLSGVVALVVLPWRLRLAVAAAIPLALMAPLFDRLTAPFSAQYESRAALEAAIPPAGKAVILLTGVALAGGLVYATADRLLRIGPRARLLIGRGAAVLVAALLLGGTAVVLDRVDEPGELLRERWEEFKQEPTRETAGTHFLSPGSNRYDFWRVALDEFRDAPLTGGGSRSFGPAYLQQRSSPETPARTHSLPLEVLAENGLVGAALLLLAVGAPLVALVRRRARVPAAAALAGGTFWLAHASVDWTWTFPTCGILFFLLLGIALSEDARGLLRPPVRVIAGAVCVVVAALAFAPPWLSSIYVEEARELGLPAGAADLRRGRSLDPLSTAPYYAEAQLATGPEARIRALQEVVRKEPESVRGQYLLGLALLESGRRAEARQALERAQALFPDEPLIRAALARSRR
jgi:hypothetical protein